MDTTEESTSVKTMIASEGAPSTLIDFCDERLRRLSQGMSSGLDTSAIRRTVRRLMEPWGRRLRGRAPSWPSPVGDDGTPFEFSLSLGRTAELRVLLEPMGDIPSLESNRQAGLALLASVEKEMNLDLSRLERVEDLFLPQGMSGSFALCIAVGFAPSRSPALKVYLDPCARGKAQAVACVEEAFSRLGLGKSWPVVTRALQQRGPLLDEIAYFSLDVSDSPEARVKLYVRHHRCTPAELADAVAAVPGYSRHDVLEFVRAIAPESRPGFDRRPPLTCMAFLADQANPWTVTSHLPVHSYAVDDATIEHRVSAYLARLGIPDDAYTHAIRTYAARPLRGRIGTQPYVSLTMGRQRRVTVYLAAEAYRAGCVADRRPAPDEGHGVTELVSRFEERDAMTAHPFFRRLRREPASLRNIWILFANFRISISRGFAAWLSALAERVEDRRIRKILDAQLDDELGGGDDQRAHQTLFAQMMDRLDGFGPAAGERERFLEPGRRLTQRLAAIYGAEDSIEGVGAVIASEIFGKQVDVFLGQELRRQRAVDVRSLSWLTVHETLEVTHAESSKELAELVPPVKQDVARRGALAIYTAGWRFLDEVYALTYGGD
jgi:DMATS type aromatic prenyltransferase